MFNRTGAKRIIFEQRVVQPFKWRKSLLLHFQIKISSSASSSSSSSSSASSSSLEQKEIWKNEFTCPSTSLFLQITLCECAKERKIAKFRNPLSLSLIVKYFSGSLFLQNDDSQGPVTTVNQCYKDPFCATYVRS